MVLTPKYNRGKCSIQWNNGLLLGLSFLGKESKRLLDLCRSAFGIGKPVADLFDLGRKEKLCKNWVLLKPKPMRGFLSYFVLKPTGRSVGTLALAPVINMKAPEGMKGTWCRWFITLA